MRKDNIKKVQSFRVELRYFHVKLIINMKLIWCKNVKIVPLT
jgi:hypothetical protein